MVDVSAKPEVFREAIAKGTIKLKPATIVLIKEGKTAKGDPLYTAKIAGILAAKKTSGLVPLCHPLPLTKVEIEAQIVGKGAVEITATVKTKAQTGVEMEALHAVAVAALTIYDMIKAVDKAMVIGEIRVVEKRGGRSDYTS